MVYQMEIFFKRKIYQSKNRKELLYTQAIKKRL